jgi:ATP-dependent Clp protease ATP-binding subunit ClpC
MFERYTERARRVLFFGRYEASQLGSAVIEPEHVLPGLVREGKGCANDALVKFGTSPQSLLRDIESRVVAREKVSTSIEIPFSEPTKRVLQFAGDEADLLGHEHIGGEHLLLGILREEECVAAVILIGRGLQLSQARDEILRLNKI